MATRKDYVAAAEIIREARFLANLPYDDPEGPVPVERIIDRIAERLANDFERGNPRFDRERFMQACRPENVEVKAR